MQNLQNDNHLDKLSREAADQFEPDQQLHSWEKLHPHLEAALPQKKERNRRFLILLFLVLLIGGGITFSALWNNRNEGSEKQLSNKIKDANKTEQLKPAHTEQDKNPSSTTELNGSEKPQTSIPARDKEETGKTTDQQPDRPLVAISPVDQDRNTQEPPNRSIVPNNRPNNQKSLKKQSNQITPQINKSIADPGIQATELKEKTDAKDKTAKKELQEIPDKSATGSQPEKTTVNKHPDNISDALQNKVAPPNEPVIKPTEEPTITVTKSSQTQKKNNQSSSLKNRWEVGLTYAPDISTVRFTHTQKPGINLGVTVAYNFSNRFALQTGLIYTTKNYKLHGKDYHPPKHYWTTYVDLKTVTGDCNMWDIPINLRYNLAPKKSSNLFATAGLSSYLMNKEDYDFYYYYQGNPVSRYRSYDTSNKHLFSVLNLSVAYERQLSRTISVQAEPFFKQPLSGVGLGNIKLNSTGIYFSVKYRPFTGLKSK